MTYNKEWYKEYAQRNKEKISEYHKKFYLEHKERIQEYHRKYYQANRNRYRQKDKAYIKLLKMETLTHYGNGECKCVSCGESRLSCLSLDHIGNDGAEERRKLGKHGSGYKFYFLLKEKGYPDGYQTLCMNCQFIKKIEGKVI